MLYSFLVKVKARSANSGSRDRTPEQRGQKEEKVIKHNILNLSWSPFNYMSKFVPLLKEISE